MDNSNVMALCVTPFRGDDDLTSSILRNTMVLLCNKEIPEELIDNIISHLEGYHKALRNCSLVCRSFTLPSQRYLFRDVCISRTITGSSSTDSESQIENCARRLARFLENNAAQLKYIQSLLTGIGSHESSLSTTISIVKQLVNLKEAHLHCRSISPSDVELIRLCCTPSIAHLTFYDGVRLPGEYLRQCTSLQHLGLRSSHFAPLEPSQSESPCSQVPLRSFFIGGSPNFDTYRWLQDPMCPITFRNLNVLGIAPYNLDNFMQWAKVLIEMAPTVEVLAVGPPIGLAAPLDNGDEPITLLNLGLLPRLKCLVFSVYEMPENGSSFLTWIISHLSTISTNNNLTELQIWMFYEDGVEADPLTDTIRDQWTRKVKRLDDMLSEPRFDKLRNVYFDMTMLDNPKAFAALTMEAMEKTNQQKFLRILKSYYDKPNWFNTLNSGFQDRIIAIGRYAKDGTTTPGASYLPI
ncbi:hypothetical protein AX16_005803 [Volvariella volvacea WC 439]|nr:hypothetical protein AX16_005803 [Volvariella volvacea WC 439]